MLSVQMAISKIENLVSMIKVFLFSACFTYSELIILMRVEANSIQLFMVVSYFLAVISLNVSR